MLSPKNIYFNRMKNLPQIITLSNPLPFQSALQLLLTYKCSMQCNRNFYFNHFHAHSDTTNALFSSCKKLKYGKLTFFPSLFFTSVSRLSSHCRFFPSFIYERQLRKPNILVVPQQVTPRPQREPLAAKWLSHLLAGNKA